MKVLYLSYDGLTDPLGQSQILPYLFGLEKRGYEFIIISFEKKQRFKEGEINIRKLLSNGNIEWIPLVYHKKPPVLSTLYDLWQMKNEARRVLKAHQVKLVHCRSYISGVVGLELKRELGCKFLFDIRGFWADERVDGGLWNLSNPLYKWIYEYFKDKEAKMMACADHIISLTHAGKKEIVSGRLFGKRKVEIKEDRITVIPCAVDLDLFDPNKIDQVKVDQLRKDLGIQRDDKVMIYLGSIGTWYLLDEMLTFFEKWSELDSNYKFLFVTKDDHQLIKEKAALNGISRRNLILAESKREDVPYHIALADVGIFFIKPSYSKKASSATKMGEFLAMGLPIITNKGVGDGDLLMRDNQTGYVLDLGEKPKDVYDKLSQSPVDNIASIELARLYFSLGKGVDDYFHVYNQLP